MGAGTGGFKLTVQQVDMRMLWNPSLSRDAICDLIIPPGKNRATG